MKAKIFLASMLVMTTAWPAPEAVFAAAATPPPTPGSLESHPEWPTAKNSGDVDTIEHLVASLYDVISGPAGKPRDWDRFRSLFLPDGRLGVVRSSGTSNESPPVNSGDAVFRTPDAYIQRNDPYFKTNGFFEQSIANRIEEFGNLAFVWSTYQSRNAASDAKPFARGVNSIQIVRARGRFWIASIMWDDERPGLALPQKYLH